MPSLDELRRKAARRIVGLMSGTSADGVSAALVEVEGCWIDTRLRLLNFRNYPYPREIREELFELFSPEKGTVDKICHMNFVLGEFFAECVIRLVEETSLSLDDVDLIGSHGQTVYHIPEPKTTRGYRTRSTLQIGELAVIAERTGIPTVGDFRKRDVAAGGEGAPLTPYLDYILHRHERLNRAFQNIGGIANLTFIPAGSSLDDLVAFDTGPGNMVIDATVRYYTHGSMNYDRDGEIAASGEVDEVLLNELLDDPYFARKPPKTTGRERFGERYAHRIIEYAREHGLNFQDVVATVTALTVETIATAYERFILPRWRLDEVYVSGGGAKNKTIMRRLAERLKPVRVYDYGRLGIPSEAKEAVLMAVLANEFVMGNTANVPRATGAKKKAVLGVFVPGSPYRRIS